MSGVKNLPIYGKTLRWARDFESAHKYRRPECNLISTACNVHKYFRCYLYDGSHLNSDQIKVGITLIMIFCSLGGLEYVQWTIMI